ncbi:hypothetical protein AaE_011663 [Aphanomyces astaci]|uniref:Uncharacterized protein n=1 Tax=Aphanomyces astaci TaxID=112090 RepID=A0A6A4ZHJ2_APHAT|nr:hypothetical protein AaE_011663 [Aphanomyces astaci]
MERYFCYEAAGDQFLGRVVAGLPVNISDFSVLPPYFANPDDPDVAAVLRVMFPRVCHLSHMIGVLRLVLASLVFHSEYLAAALPSSHALLQTALFCSVNTRESLMTNLAVPNSVTTLRSTGIPPHIEIYKKLEANHASILAIPSAVLGGVTQILEERGAMAAHITKDVLESCLTTALSGCMQARPSPDGATNQRETNDVTRTMVFEWGGHFRRLPREFKFPSVNVSTAWRLWWLGNGAQNILPFSKILPFDLATKTNRDTLSEWKALMTPLHNHVSNSGIELDRTSSEADVLAAFDVAKLFLLPLMSRNTAYKKRSFDQLKVCTVIKLVRLAEGSKTQRPFQKRKSRA